MYTATLERPAALSCCPKEEPADARRAGDCDLARRIQAGDHAAFQELVECHQSRIFRVIYAILRNPADAEDVAQEVFAKVYFSIRTFNCRSTLFSWIYRIAVNECYSWLRKRRVRLVFESDSAGTTPGLGLDAAPDRRPTADRALAHSDFLNKLLARMPKDDRVLLLCKELEGLSVVELAEMTGLNENTVKVKLFRARRRFAELAARLSRPSPPGTNSGR
jgi:RNA polymerase sigma-70 factor (ECF subfamily)